MFRQLSLMVSLFLAIETAVPMVLFAEDPLQNIEIVSADDSNAQANQADESTVVSGHFTRTKKVSKYGTLAFIQKPIEWIGKGIDGLVHGIGYAGSAIFTVPIQLIHRTKPK